MNEERNENGVVVDVAEEITDFPEQTTFNTDDMRVVDESEEEV